jgi:GTP cyclohydrolase I
MEISKKIKSRLLENNARFYSNDNISDFIKKGELHLLIDEIADKFQSVLDSLVIDTENDPNAHDTSKRLAKMYINELMQGRYYPMPDATSFPNDSADRYHGMLVVRSEIKSLCSHHHQPVHGVAYIGIIAAERLIGLSKYTRIAQWCSRRGTLQEELCNTIANEIIKVTGSKNVAVHIGAQHECCTNRGIMVTSSLTQTTVLYGAFNDDAATKKEFFDNITLQRQACTGVY